MQRSLSRVLPIPHLFMGVSITLLLALFFLASGPSSPATAEVVDGTCTGTVTMDGEPVIDAQQARSVPAVVPDRGIADVVGGFDVEPSDQAVPYRGELRGQHAFGSWVITSWTGQTSTSEVVASQAYALPNFIPRGSGPVPLVLDVSVGTDSCRIIGMFAVAGPTFDGLTIVLLGVTLVLLAATLGAGRAGRRGFGRPFVGLVTGVLAGAAGAVTLFGAGAISLDSNVWWFAPLVVAALGAALGMVAPFGRKQPERELPESDRDEADTSSHAAADGIQRASDR